MAIVNDTPALYASVVVTPYIKWLYFEHTWKDVHTWKDASRPRSWLSKTKKALYSLWEKYKYMEIPAEELQICGEKRARFKSFDDFEKATDMTLIQTNEEEIDELDNWLQSKCFKLPKSDTLLQYWVR